MTTRSRWTLVVAMVLLVALVAAGCSSDGSSLPPADELPELEFGDGELPVTIPEGFPIPEGTSIGTTMIDGGRTVTEVVMIFPLAQAEVLAFYERELPEAGYEITGTKEESIATTIDFTGNGIDGSITVRIAGPSLAEGFLSTVYSS